MQLVNKTPECKQDPFYILSSRDFFSLSGRGRLISPPPPPPPLHMFSRYFGKDFNVVSVRGIFLLNFAKKHIASGMTTKPVRWSNVKFYHPSSKFNNLVKIRIQRPKFVLNINFNSWKLKWFHYIKGWGSNILCLWPHILWTPLPSRDQGSTPGRNCF